MFEHDANKFPDVVHLNSRVLESRFGIVLGLCIYFFGLSKKFERRKGVESIEGIELHKAREAARGYLRLICGTRNRLLYLGHGPCLSNVVSRTSATSLSRSLEAGCCGVVSKMDVV